MNAIATNALSLALEHEPVTGEQRITGDPVTGSHRVHTFGDRQIGVWEMTPGVMSDTETGEIFVVIAGAAVIEFVDEGRALPVTVGDIVRLNRGDRTLWTVTETLRKVYIA